MQPGIYEAVSLIGPAASPAVAYVVLEDTAEHRIQLHTARTALGVLRWQVHGSTRVLVDAALEGLEQP